MKKNVFSLFVVLSIGMVISCSDSAIEESDSSKTELVSLTSMYTEFINSFEDTSTRGLGKISMSYPDYFGGAYVKDNKIIVFFKNGIDKEEAKKELSNRIDLSYLLFSLGLF